MLNKVSNKGVRKVIKKKWGVLILSAALALSLSACGGGEQASESQGSSSNASSSSASNAEAIVKQSCVSCHGADLSGGVGPALNNVGSRLSKDEILNIIQNGKGGMPGGLISGADAEAVASWLAEKK